LIDLLLMAVMTAACVLRTLLIRDEDQPSESVQVLADGSLQFSDVTTRDVSSSFTCLIPLENDDRIALAETFTITLQGA